MNRLLQACGVAAGLLIGVMALLVTFDVVSRNLGFRSVTWILEITEYSLPLATLLAAPWLLSRNEHVKLDILARLLPAGGRRLTERFAALIALAVSVVLVWYSAAALQNTLVMNSVVIKNLTFPEWWLFAPLPLLFGLLALTCLRQLFKR